MILPNDNETDAVIITPSPAQEIARTTGAAGLPIAPSSSLATNSRFVPFFRTLGERWLRRTIALAMLIFIIAYQFFPSYEAILDQGTIPSSSRIPMRLVGDWQPPKAAQPPYIWGLRTIDSGGFYLPNFGYPLGFGSYDLELQVAATRPLSFTVSVGSEVIGTYAAQNDGYSLISSIPASAFLAASPHPTITFAITRSASASAGSLPPTLVLNTFHIQAPSLIVLTIPPVLNLLSALLLALCCCLVVRKTNRVWQTPPQVFFGGLFAFVSILIFWIHPTERIDLLSNLLWVVFLVGLLALVDWRRELANWLLHLRHPDDERFRLS